MADRLLRQGFSPPAVREAVRPDEGTRDDPADAAAPEADELIRQVRRRYPGQGGDQGERRRALGWLARRGLRADDARHILEAAAAPDD
jgi:hypothetical protein